jgi:hypothetical protein
VVPEPKQVHDIYFVAAVKQFRDQNASDVSRAARDKNFHAALLLLDL